MSYIPVKMSLKTHAAVLVMIKEIHQLKSGLVFPTSYQYRKENEMRAKTFYKKTECSYPQISYIKP